MRNQFLLIALTNCQMFAFAQAAEDPRSPSATEGHRLHEEGRYRDAEAAFRTALREAELQEHTENIATSLSDLSLPLEATGQFTEAESVLLRAAALWEKVGEGAGATNMRHRLANIYFRQARYQKAAPLFLRAAEEWTKLLGPRHLDVALAITGLASVKTCLGRYAEAEKLYHRGLSILDGDDPTHKGLTASTLNNLSQLVNQLGRRREAVGLARRALAIQRKYLPDGHPDMAVSLNNLGVGYQGLGKLKEAQANFHQAIDLVQRTLGPNHPSMAGPITNLGSVYFSRRRYAEAVEHFLRAIEIYEKSLGPSHPDLAVAAAGLAGAYLGLSNIEAADHYCQRALSIWRSTLGTNHPQYTIGLSIQAELLRRRHRKKEAENVDRQAKEILSNHSRRDGGRAVIDVRTLAEGQR